MTFVSSNIPALPVPPPPPSHKSRLAQPKASFSTRTSQPQALPRPQTSKSTTTLPRRTTATPKPSISTTTRVLATPQVGDRVVLENGLKGTLKFLGETSFKKGSWAGIELDELGAGKNSGSVNGTSYFQCRPQTGLFVLAHKVQLLERRKLSPSNEQKSISSPLRRQSTLQHKVGTKLAGGEKMPPIEVEDLQAALAKALNENASLKDNQDQVVRLEKLLTSQKLLNDSLQSELEHAKKVHAVQINNCHEESQHLSATIDELEAVNRVLNSSLAELSTQPSDHPTTADPGEIHRLQNQCTDLQNKYNALLEQLEREKDQHLATKRQLAKLTARQYMEETLKNDLEQMKQKLKCALQDAEELKSQKNALNIELQTLTFREQEAPNQAQTDILLLNTQLSEQQAENEDLKFAMQELTIALENAKEQSASMALGASEVQQDQRNQLQKLQSELGSLKEKYDETSKELNEEREAREKAMEQVSQLRTTVTEREATSNDLELSNIKYKVSLSCTQQRVSALEDELVKLQDGWDLTVLQLEKRDCLIQDAEENQECLIKDAAEKQRIIDELLGDISELQDKVNEYRDQTDVHLEEIDSLRQTNGSKNEEHRQLQEAHKQLESECLKLMDEIIVNSKDDNTDAISNVDAPNSFSYALQLSHKRTKALEAKLEKVQSEMTARLHSVSQQHAKAISAKDASIAKLSNELSDMEHLVENKLFRESELEEWLAREQALRKTLEQEVLDLQAERSAPISPQSEHSPERSTKTNSTKDSHYIASTESYCGICDSFGHDTINCDKIESHDMMKVYPAHTTTNSHHIQPHCDYCELSADIPHWTDDCPNQQESY